jgi:hypothetical protein
MRKQRLTQACLFLALLLAVGGAAQELQPLTNQDVIKLVKAGLGKEVIIGLINKSPAKYDLSVDGLLALAQNRVPDEVIKAMQAKAGGAAAMSHAGSPSANAGGALTPPAAAHTAPALEVGVYYVNGQGQHVEVQPENTNWRTGGWLKTISTGGFVSGDVNGSVEKPRSALRLSAPAEFVIRCAEGVSASEYQLLKLNEKGARREFRIDTGGFLGGMKSEARRGRVEFAAEKIGPATYRIKLAALAKGEYGFLAPNAQITGTTSSGKIYTFGVE